MSLWDPPDQSCYDTEDDWKYYFSLGYGCDLIEEDAENMKYCVQVLKINIEKADEDIIKLEEDIVMLQFQLAWDDENWSKTFSTVLEAEIHYLGTLIERLKEYNEHRELPQRLHDLVKSLYENFLLQKTKQTESVVKKISILEASGFGKKTLAEAKKCVNMLEKNDEEKSPSMEPEVSEINHPINPEPCNPIVKDSKAKTTQTGLAQKIKVENSYMDSRETATGEVHELDKPADVILDSQLDHVQTIPEDSSKNTRKRKFPENATETKNTDTDSLIGFFKDAIKIKTEKLELQEINQAKSNSLLKPEGQGPKKKYKTATQSVRISSSIGNSKGQQQKVGVREKIIKKETQGKSGEASDTCGVEGVSVNSPLCIRDVEKLTYKDLKTIARDQKLSGYSKMKKDELRKRLGLDPQDLAKRT